MPTRPMNGRVVLVAGLGVGLLLALVLLVPPSQREPERQQPNEEWSVSEAPQRTTEPAHEQAEATRLVRLRGRVVLRGERPERRRLRIGTSDWALSQFDTERGPYFDERFQVSEDGGVPHAFVWVEVPKELAVEARTAEPSTLPAATLTFREVRLTPHVLGLRVGQRLQVTNEVATLMCMKYQSKRNGSDNKSLAEGASMQAIFTKKEAAIPFSCDCHKWIGAWVFAIDHPWFAVTDQDGSFALPDLPRREGRPIELRVWHETFATKRDTVKQELEPWAGEVLVEIHR